MPHRATTALEGCLRPHVALSKSRLEPLCLVVVGMVSARTVNLGHIACERPGPALTASTYRRLQRFFQHVRLGQDSALPLVAQLLGPARRWTLVLDRTQWSIGRREVTYLVLAVVTRHFRVPLLWTLLPRAGNSATAVRIALVERYLAHFPASTIAILLADREFVGADWLKSLNDHEIPFAIRLREHLRVVTEDGCELTLAARLRGARGTRTLRGRLWADGAADGPAPQLRRPPRSALWCPAWWPSPARPHSRAAGRCTLLKRCEMRRPGGFRHSSELRDVDGRESGHDRLVGLALRHLSADPVVTIQSALKPMIVITTAPLSAPGLPA